MIIWVLAAALIPRLTSVRWRANDVARKADIQQLATAIITFQMDHNGRLPVAEGTIMDLYSVSWITGALITAWMDWLPVDPTPENSFYFDENVYTWAVNTWNYGYIRVVKDGVANAWFVLMAKSQTAWWSNRVTSGWSTIWLISSNTAIDTLRTCKTIEKSATGLRLNNGWDCQYVSVADLRYIMAR